MRGHTSKEQASTNEAREAKGKRGGRNFRCVFMVGAALESTLPNREEPIGFRVLILDSSTWVVGPFGVPGTSQPFPPTAARGGSAAPSPPESERHTVTPTQLELLLMRSMYARGPEKVVFLTTCSCDRVCAMCMQFLWRIVWENELSDDIGRGKR